MAGLVLGAFPIAIWALEQYRDVARRMGFWYEIRLEYQRSSHELKFHRLSFLRNLKQLLLPLATDDAHLERLLADPGGPAWKDPAIAAALTARLQESHVLYLEILSEMERVMQELNRDLALDNEGVQKKVKGEKVRGSRPRRHDYRRAVPGCVSITPLQDAHRPNVKPLAKFGQSFDKKNRDYQLFRIKFSNGEHARRRLFDEFQTYNDRLEKLMATSDTLSKLESSRQVGKTTFPASSVNAAICKFWNHADRLYKAILCAWNCGCHEQHSAQLVLQHRTTPEKDFRLCLSSSSSTPWPVCPVRVKMLDRPSSKGFLPLSKETKPGKSVSISTPQHRAKVPARPALAPMNGRRKAGPLNLVVPCHMGLVGQ